MGVEGRGLVELPKGRLRLNSLEEVTRWVLSFEDHATVIEPEALRERMEETATMICGRYGKNGE